MGQPVALTQGPGQRAALRATPESPGQPLPGHLLSYAPCSQEPGAHSHGKHQVVIAAFSQLTV